MGKGKWTFEMIYEYGNEGITYGKWKHEGINHV